MAGPVEDEPPPWAVFDEGPPEPPPLPPDPLPPGAGPDERWTPQITVDDDGADLGELLASVLPGPRLAAELEDIDPRSVDLYALVEMVAAYQRIASWASARATELSGALAGRPGINPHHPLPGGKEAASFAAAELAPRLGVTRFAARRMVDSARLFRDKLDQTAQALREGFIDQSKSAVLVRHLADQPADVAWEVQRLVLPDARHQTPSQLARAVEKAIIAVDPSRAIQRHRRARDQRRVDHPRPLPDGMASIHALLPATDAAGLDLALEAGARSAKASGDSRTIDQLRADVLALMGHTALELGYVGLPAAKEADTDGGSTRAPSVDTGTPVPPDGVGNIPPDDGAAAAPSDAYAPHGDEADEDSAVTVGSAPPEAHDPPGGPPGTGHGPPDVPSAASPELQPVSDYMRMLHMPVGTIGGRRAEIVVDTPLSVLVLPPESQGLFPAAGECLAHLTGDADDLPGDSSAQDGDPEDDDTYQLAEVAELRGYGPITPDVARALAMTAGTWQRIVTDPLSGELLDVGRTRYRPPAALAEFVRARDRTCIIPGCSTPAHSCELDHVVPFPGGPTSASNLGAGCRPDHTVKTLGQFQLEHLGAGTFRWTTPSGHVYQRDHHGRVTWVRGTTDTSEPPF